jgi:hypothetical protein
MVTAYNFSYLLVPVWGGYTTERNLLIFRDFSRGALQNGLKYIRISF